jgi:hypothetical protein
MIHEETRQDAQGRIVATVAADVKYAVGAGAQAVSFFVEREDRLFQSPVTWYVKDRRWGLSPGYDRSNGHFDRAVVPQCLFCHANRVEPLGLSANKYVQPVFHDGGEIGCERCHGPGELHVSGSASSELPDWTIVNPRHLEPRLREAVCEQCHLLGDQRVERAGRGVFDYRPGLPLTSFIAIFNREREREKKFGGHVEQMRASRCYRASQGRLGCISCHNPHELPAPDKRIAYFRDRCLTCHDKHGCSLPEAARRSQGPEDDCVRCHMQAFPKTEIAHVATTDHRILRMPEEGRETPVHKAAPGSPLTLVHAEDLDAGEQSACERERAIALATEGPMVGDPKLRAQLGTEAQAIIDGFLAAQPEDVAARHARARSLRLQGRLREAMAGYDELLREAPDFEAVLDEAGSLAAELGDRTSALRFARRSVSLNPWSSALRERLAQSLFFDRKWTESIEEAAAALRLNPFLPLPRTIRVHAALQTNDLALARQEIDTLIALNPSQRKILEDWFEQQRRATAQRH